MGITYNIDYQEGATIVTNPTNKTGKWGQIMCLSNCSGVVVEDQNLTPDSEPWGDQEFTKGSIVIGLFTKITLFGKVVLYA